MACRPNTCDRPCPKLLKVLVLSELETSGKAPCGTIICSDWKICPRSTRTQLPLGYSANTATAAADCWRPPTPVLPADLACQSFPRAERTSSYPLIAILLAY